MRIFHSDRADVNSCDQFFWTPLHHAAHAGQVEIMELLLNAGAAVDAPGLGGGTPLMRAIESSQPICVDYLIKAGASVTAENKKGTHYPLSQRYQQMHIIMVGSGISWVTVFLSPQDKIALMLLEILLTIK